MENGEQLATVLACAALVFGLIGMVLPEASVDVDSPMASNGSLVPTRWDDLNFPALVLSKEADFGPTLGNISTSSVETLMFNGVDKMNMVFMSSEILHSYKEGSNITPHIHWMPTTSGAGNVEWWLQYAWLSVNGTYSLTTSVNVTQAAGGVAWKHLYIDFPAVNGSGQLIGSQIFFKLYRNPLAAVDTYGADAALMSFGIHFEMDTIGSSSQLSK
jgi:hypothetical protein